MRKVIITDLTRFSTKEKVCIAAIDIETGECFRPMPYLLNERCSELNIQPGAILEGNISYQAGAVNPHIEDANYENLTFNGAASTDQFKDVLERSTAKSVSEGFGIDFSIGQKHIPVEEVSTCSIITVKVSPKQIELHEDQYKIGKVKCSFTDSSGRQFRYLSITDRGFYDFAEKHQADNSLHELQQFVSSQEEIYLRIGVGRVYQVGERNGYWLQVNGIYTFPEFHKEIRSYK
jgi:hypothetical protein